MTKELLNELDDFIQVELLDKQVEMACHLRDAWDEIYAAAMKELRNKESYEYQIPSFLKRGGVGA